MVSGHIRGIISTGWSVIQPVKGVMDATTWMNLESVWQVQEARHQGTDVVQFHLHETGKAVETEGELPRVWRGSIVDQ